MPASIVPERTVVIEPGYGADERAFTQEVLTGIERGKADRLFFLIERREQQPVLVRLPDHLFEKGACLALGKRNVAENGSLVGVPDEV
ncbi:MAG: hypothetical protein RIE06_20305 [Roseibium album]|uniref:hypothetical protein n=1 Tax=Roseibium album TaxID=311410 RepID=UPI0032EDEEB8